MAGNTCCLHASVRQFQCKLGGQQIFPQPLDYSYDHFINEVSKANSICGALESGLSSGLVGGKDYITNSGFIYVDLSRQIADDVVQKSIEVSFVNNTLVNMDYLTFVGISEYKDIDCESGLIVV